MQFVRQAGRTSSFYLKPWPVRILEDFPFSLYIVAASESDEGLVFTLSINMVEDFEAMLLLNTEPNYLNPRKRLMHLTL